MTSGKTASRAPLLLAHGLVALRRDRGGRGRASWHPPAARASRPPRRCCGPSPSLRRVLLGRVLRVVDEHRRRPWPARRASRRRVPRSARCPSRRRRPCRRARRGTRTRPAGGCRARVVTRTLPPAAVVDSTGSPSAMSRNVILAPMVAEVHGEVRVVHLARERLLERARHVVAAVEVELVARRRTPARRTGSPGCGPSARG